MSKSDQVRGPIGRTMLLVTCPPPAPNGNLGDGPPQDISVQPECAGGSVWFK